MPPMIGSSNVVTGNLVKETPVRACDGCVKSRARWYCSADDAFLCHACDSSVHSANPLAARHERVLLKPRRNRPSLVPPSATWHIRKARSPRGKKKHQHYQRFLQVLVPEIGAEEHYSENNIEEEQLIYRVPVFEPIKEEHRGNDVVEAKRELFNIETFNVEEFAADVEALLSCETDTWRLEESFDLMVDCNSHSSCGEEANQENTDINVKEEEEEAMIINSDGCDEMMMMEEKKHVFKLRLDYEAVIATWNGHGPPWTAGELPEFDLWNTNGLKDPIVWPQSSTNSGREARISRYREKRRTRLFSKKIRYEVRKLNAEKRPRMKGRFVKRSSSPASAEISVIDN